MTSAAIEQTSTRSTSTSNTAVPGGGGSSSEALASSQGRTTVADTVVQKIAGRAAREVSGVHDFGGGSPVTARPPSATPLAPPGKERSS